MNVCIDMAFVLQCVERFIYKPFYLNDFTDLLVTYNHTNT